MLSINYTYEHINNTFLLKNYILFTGLHHQIIATPKEYTAHKQQIIAQTLKDIQTTTLLRNLHNASDKFFDNRYTRDILILAYPVEIEYKFLGKELSGYHDNQIYHLLCKLFDIPLHHDYHNHDSIIPTFTAYRKHTYQSHHIKTIISQFLQFIEQILLPKYSKEYQDLKEFFNNHLYIQSDSHNNITTMTNNIDITICLANNKITTLLHELTHVVNKFFRNRDENQQLLATKFTKYTEGFANFIAYNCFDSILHNTHIHPHPMFVSPYSYTYQQLQSHGFKTLNHSKSIIQKSMTIFSKEYTDQVDYFHQRFFKFFSPYQHQYLYPKELLYQIGYDHILNTYQQSQNKQSLLAHYILNNFW